MRFRCLLGRRNSPATLRRAALAFRRCYVARYMTGRALILPLKNRKKMLCTWMLHLIMPKKNRVSRTRYRCSTRVLSFSEQTFPLAAVYNGGGLPSTGEKLFRERSNWGSKESVSGLKYGFYDTVIQHEEKEAKVTFDGYSKWCSPETITGISIERIVRGFEYERWHCENALLHAAHCSDYYTTMSLRKIIQSRE
ncbi:hypothetical protein PUN28_003230 [Cardiocondyla obscurior]|uniref:Uncharacterized protein n=1 Tax=Cardiocondyla obscurior TaxID=286306 RepID=A0AAW2GJU1_9HYME